VGIREIIIGTTVHGQYPLHIEHLGILRYRAEKGSEHSHLRHDYLRLDAQFDSFQPGVTTGTGFTCVLRCAPMKRDGYYNKLQDMLYDINICYILGAVTGISFVLDIDGFSYGIATSINLSCSSHGTDILMCCTAQHIQQKQETSFEQSFCLLCFAGCIAGPVRFFMWCDYRVMMFCAILVALKCKAIEMCLKDLSLSVQ